MKTTDEEATRSSEQPARPDTIELADGVTAAVTVECDEAPATRALPKQLRNGTYTIYAIQGSEVKGTLAFTVENGQIKKQLSHTYWKAPTPLTSRCKSSMEEYFMVNR